MLIIEIFLKRCCDKNNPEFISGFIFLGMWQKFNLLYEIEG